MDEYETQRERNAQNRGCLVGLFALFLTVNSFAAPVAMQISLCAVSQIQNIFHCVQKTECDHRRHFRRRFRRCFHVKSARWAFLKHLWTRPTWWPFPFNNTACDEDLALIMKIPLLASFPVFLRHFRRPFSISKAQQATFQQYKTFISLLRFWSPCKWWISCFYHENSISGVISGLFMTFPARVERFKSTPRQCPNDMIPFPHYW